MENQVGSASSTTHLSGICLTFSFHSNSWILDSGVTNHIVSFVSLLSSITSTNSTTIKPLDSSLAPITQIGIVSLSPFLTLHDVLCAPSFHFNLISVSKLTYSLNCSLTFHFISCLVQDLTSRKMIGKGKELFCFQ